MVTDSKPKILGFTLHYKNDRWHACKRINNKLRWVYVGNDMELAEQKIRDWCNKNDIAIETFLKPTFLDLQQRLAFIEGQIAELYHENQRLSAENTALKSTLDNQQQSFLETLARHEASIHSMIQENKQLQKKITKITQK